MPRPSCTPAADRYTAVVAAPVFAIGILCTADEILGLEYLGPQQEQPPKLPLAAEAVRQLRAYFADPRFVFGLPLTIVGTSFQRRVRDAIAAIPSGETRSYGEIARAVRSAPRAVGGACGANPFPLVIPCHRVIAADGGLGGFGGKREDDSADSVLLLDIKRWLLRHESA